ncbi:hypothetical protein ALC57_17633, partial [Trachymyrmex cornetzi]
NSNHIEPRLFLEDASEIVLERVQCIMQRYDSIQINTIFNDEFVTGDKRANKSIATRNYELYLYTDLREWSVTRVVEPILTSLEEFQERDSGWALSRILNLAVNANKHTPLRAGCHIKLQREIMLKRAVINVQSANDACFAWSVIADLHPAPKHVERVSSYPHYSTGLNLAGIEFPMTLSQIRKFKNSNDISINVYAIEKGIVPIRLADRKKSSHVNLLYVEDDSAGHFVLIKDLSRLVSSQINKKEHKKYFCDRAQKTRVRDHCHLTGRYRGHAHSNCNLKTEELKNLALSVQTIISANVPMADFTRDDWEKFNSASHCHVCEKPCAKDADYYTLPGFTWDAMLKHTGVKFELLTDIDMVMFVERGIRGGLSQCTNRYARANNKYDPSKPSSYLMYYDINNLYGWAMCQPLHFADFRRRAQFRFYDLALDPQTGYILEVDLEYPQHLHDAHKKDTKKAKGVKSSVVAKSITFEDYKQCLNDFELHIPGYQFCGPGTRLEKRLARGDRDINPLDAACREHESRSHSRLGSYEAQNEDWYGLENKEEEEEQEDSSDSETRRRPTGSTVVRRSQVIGRKKRYAVLFDMYARFCKAYYGIDSFETLLNVLSFIEKGSFAVIDCSRQNESVKSATVDVRIEFDCKENVPANTTPYCLIIHDRVIEYCPLSNVVRKIM